MGTTEARARSWINARLATMDPSSGHPYGALEGPHALRTRHGRIEAVMPMRDWRPASGEEAVDAAGRWMTPGLVDCHTHLVWGGDRAGEFERRLAGASYAEIAAGGGGIRATVRATRATSEEELARTAAERLAPLLAEGLTTVEIKSGYGLTLADELKQLRAARRVASLVTVRATTTLLAAHAVPPEFEGRADDYVSHVCDAILPAAAAEGLADAVDVFCERIAFSPEQCARVFGRARELGLPVKGHMEQLSNLGGSRLAASHGALSADHVEYLDEAGVEALAHAGTCAVLLPGAFYFLRETQRPPVEALRRAGVPMAVATDLNPGTSPFASLRLAANMACVLFGLTVEEAFAAITREAARALGLAGRRGVLAGGADADLALWSVPHPNALVYEPMAPRLWQRVLGGEIVA
ncbi:imidazolonepropionase [Craurococcus roseus]|uniref:Imidazolonepropionase n=1 Tax=Craurococcus roseus TaxID=77585 RepID=A0ABN1FE54_9PROT